MILKRPFNLPKAVSTTRLVLITAKALLGPSDDIPHTMKSERF